MSKNELKYGVYLSYISLFVTNISNLILTPFIIKSLGNSQYGLYMLIGAFVGYIAVLDFGLGNTVVRFVAKYRAENDKKSMENFLFSTFIIYGVISSLVVIIGTIIYFNITKIFGNSLTSDEIFQAKIMFIILVVNLALTLPMKTFTSIMTAYERFILPRSLTIIRTIVRMLIIYILLTIGYKAVAIVVVDTVLNILMLFIIMIFVLFKLKVRIRLYFFDKKIFKEILSYSSLIFISVVVDQLYWRIGHLILGIVSSTTEVAIFAIGIMFGQYFITFSTSISGVFLPRITTMVVKKASAEELTNTLIKTGRLQFIVLGLILGCFIILGKEFVYLWVGSDYYTSWIIGLIIMIPLFFVLTQTVGISILQAKNMHGFRAFSYLAIAIINTIISIFLAKSYGAIGAAVGTSLSLILGNIIVMNLYYHFKVKLNITRFYKELFQGLLVSILFSLSVGSLLSFAPGETWMYFIFKGILYIILYLVILWKFGMNDYEKKIFKNEFVKLNRFV